MNRHVEPGAAPFAALVAPGQPSSGAYGGMSLVVFLHGTTYETSFVDEQVSRRGYAEP